MHYFTQAFVLIVFLSLFICELDLVQLCFGIEGQWMVEPRPRAQLNAYQHHYEPRCISSPFQRCWPCIFLSLLRSTIQHTHTHIHKDVTCLTLSLVNPVCSFHQATTLWNITATTCSLFVRSVPLKSWKTILSPALQGHPLRRECK